MKKLNQYKLTIYNCPDGETRVEIWWYEHSLNTVTGEMQKIFLWFAYKGCFAEVTKQIKSFFAFHYPMHESSWPLTADLKEPKRDKNNQSNFQF